MSWGNKLVIVFLVFAGLMATLVYNAVTTKFELVSIDYYKDELRYQEKIDGAANAAEAGKMILAQDTSTITIALPASLQTSQLKGEAWFYCKTNAKHDMRMPVQIENGSFVIDKKSFSKDSYELKLQLSVKNKQYYFRAYYRSIMFWQVFIPGFFLGAISSFHCVGMCGPLAISLPLAQFSPAKKVSGILLYNLGRVVTYSFIGLIFGFLGRQIYIAGFQQFFSITIGVIILSFFILSIFKRKLSVFKPANKYYMTIQSLVVKFMTHQGLSGMFVTGIANGLLPCGMVYLAITGALATSNVLYGMEFMAAFGIGTFL